MINIAVKAARRAASVITRASFEIEQIRVIHKGHNDFVTEVDQAAEQAIVDVLRQAYPDHAILAEESGASANLHKDSENVWIIDPLDGTTNFIHGLPLFSISIALQYQNKTILGIIYEVSNKECF
jgi:myo-inositol-1(or 4)-monophosphatase